MEPLDNLTVKENLERIIISHGDCNHPYRISCYGCCLHLECMKFKHSLSEKDFQKRILNAAVEEYIRLYGRDEYINLVI